MNVKPAISKKLYPKESHEIALIKKGIWLYFLLLIFEGALRKWFLPFLATPLLVIRDPLAIMLIYLTWRQGMFPSTPYLTVMVAIGIIGIFTALFFGHGSLAVAIFGARIVLIHFPLIFVIGKIFNRDDVIKLGKVTLWIAIPMAMLVAVQFYSPQSAWVNRGVGGSTEGAGFQGALGYFRPPATFSFHVGTYLFFGLAACFIIFFWFKPQGINRIMLIGATAGLIVSVPLSISRSLLFHVAMSLLFAVLAVIRKPKNLGKMLWAGTIILIALAYLKNTSFFQTGTDVLFARFDSAGQTEGGVQGAVGNRYIGGMLAAFTQFADLPFFGYGLGMGTNAGSALLTGKVSYLISETEWGRMIGEQGLVMGSCAIFIRVGIVGKIGLACYRKLELGDLLPWMLLSFGILNIPNNQWSQPTILGFSTIIGGLMIASLKSPAKAKVAFGTNRKSLLTYRNK